MLSMAVFSCKNEDEPVLPIISGFTPTNGPVTTAVTIFGANFGTTSPTVKFGTVTATVTSFSATQIVTSVPAGATTGKISVTVGTTTVTSTSDFTVGGFPTVTKGTGPANAITEITANETWTASNRYLLKGLVVVKDGVTLTIEPGTVIFGDKATRGGLIIARGGKINAIGTSTSPIVFTSSQPKGERSYGDWIGILIAGKAANNASANRAFEGLPSNALFQYGIGAGADTPADNSGTLKYVRIEFSGIAISDGNETNGLTMGSVGSGTTIEYVQISFGGDDSFEWFGGTVNGKWLITFRGFDDDFDTDNGYSGKVQYGLALTDPYVADQSQSNNFESDNDATGSINIPITSAVFSNITSVGYETRTRAIAATDPGNGNYVSGVRTNNAGRALHIRRNTGISVYNSVFIGGSLAGLSLDGTAVQGKFEDGTANAIEFRANVFAGTRSASGSGSAGTAARGGVFAYEGGNGFTFSVNATNTAFATDSTSFYTLNTTAGLNLQGGSPSAITVTDALKLENLTRFSRITNPALLLDATSPLATGAVFTGKAATGFTTTGTFRGAFGTTTNWAADWTNFDPQNTDY